MSSSSPTNPSDVKMLPGTAAGGGAVVASSAPSVPAAGVIGAPPTSAAQTRQLSDLPKDELEHLADEFGLDYTRYKTRQHLVIAIHGRGQMIAAMSREAMLDVIRWGRRPVTFNATKEQIAQEIARITSMRFAGLSQRGLVVLARLRGVACSDADAVPVLIKRLKKQEGFFSKLNRKRRAMLGAIVSNMIGEEESAADYQFLPPPAGSSPGATPTATAPPPGGTTIKREIEESGLFGGIAGRIKKSADAYVNQKLDEIEARIDRKLDEIDRRLAEWRDKEIANRIRILKITLWASVIVAVVSLVYSYVKVYIVPGGRLQRPSGMRPLGGQSLGLFWNCQRFQRPPSAYRRILAEALSSTGMHSCCTS